jgi:hypothetical protein
MEVLTLCFYSFHCEDKKFIFLVQILCVLHTVLKNDYNYLRNRTSETKKSHACVTLKKKEFAGK